MNKCLTYKEFFEKSKTEPRLQRLVGQCLISAIRVAESAKQVFPGKKTDIGELMLSGIKTLAQIEGFVIVKKEEINAEYMSEILNSYKGV